MEKTKRLFVEIADDHYKRAYGLMDRKSLGRNSGMLFRFPEQENLHFWMANTYIPLDIAFLDDDGKILQIESMSPLSTRKISSCKPCKYALEVNRGWFRDNNIRVGNYIGGVGISDLNKIAQMSDPNLISPPPSAQQPAQQVQPQVPSPDVKLDLSFKQLLEKAHTQGKDLIAIYRTKGGIVLPPKSISPPFTFEKDADGKHDAIVKVWDNQDAEWKSFIIDNIISLEEKDKSKKDFQNKEGII